MMTWNTSNPVDYAPTEHRAGRIVSREAQLDVVTVLDPWRRRSSSAHDAARAWSDN